MQKLITGPFNSFFKTIVEWLLYSNLFLALCAASLVWETEIQLGISSGIDPISIMVFFATLFLYGIHHIMSVRRIADENKNRHLKWAKRYIFALFILTLLVGGIVASWMFYLNFASFLLILPLGLISLLYELPLFPLGKKYVRLRNIGLLKIFWITLVWTGVTVWLPALQYGEHLNGIDVITVSLMRIHLVICLCLSFDLRDMEYDFSSGTTTFPILLGRSKTIRLISWLLLFYFLIAVIQFVTYQNYDFGKLASAAVTAMLAYRLIVAASITDKWYFYPLFVEGIMILNFLLLQFDN